MGYSIFECLVLFLKERFCMSSEGNYDHINTAYEDSLWGNEEIDPSQIGGTTSYTFPLSQGVFTCPLVLANITNDGPELDKCLKCSAQRTKKCGGYNGSAPVSLNGVTIVHRK